MVDDTVEGAVEGVNDAVRYTFASETGTYACNADEVLARLRQQGFEPVKASKNTCGSNRY